MDIKTEIDGSKATIALAGKLTVQTSPDLKDAIDGLGEGVSDLDIDFTDVSYVASAGLRVLVAADKLATARGGGMRLLHPSDEINEIFEMTGLADVFTIER